MGSADELKALIKYQLSQLPVNNGHHDFEHLCRQLVRRRICSNVLPATGPVSAGGDQGRDFETFRTYLNRSSAFGNIFVGLISEKPVVFACTTQKEDLPGKIKADVITIMKSGAPVEGIHYLCSSDVQVGRRHRLKDWAREEYSVELEILDGESIAELLTDPEFSYLVQRHLSLPVELLFRDNEDGVPYGAYSLKHSCTSPSVNASQLIFSLERRLRGPLLDLAREAEETLKVVSNLLNEHDRREHRGRELRHVYYDSCRSISSVLTSQIGWNDAENLHWRLGSLTSAEDKVAAGDLLTITLGFVMYYCTPAVGRGGIFNLWRKASAGLPVDPDVLADDVRLLCNSITKAEGEALSVRAAAICQGYYRKHEEVKILSEETQTRLMARLEFDGYLDEKERMPCALRERYRETVRKLGYLDKCDLSRFTFFGRSFNQLSHIIYLGVVLTTVANYNNWGSPWLGVSEG